MPLKPKTVKELKSTHQYYQSFITEWEFLYAAYEGTRELVEKGYLRRNERESLENWKRRKDDAYGFDYSQSVVDILNFYLHKKPVKREFPDPIQKEPLFEAYQKDCNLNGDSLDEFFIEQSRLASIVGHVGILVDKPSAQVKSRQEALENMIYPYVSAYLPSCILDWEYTRDEYGRMRLSMVKLCEEDGRYLIWHLDHFEVWEVPISTSTVKTKQLLDDIEAKLILESEHRLKEIPFFFLVNKRARLKPLGKSDISDIARIDVSIIRNLSQGEEVIDYGAFPMMRKPSREMRPDQSQTDQTDDVGPTAILTFDPENPESKPDWLESEVADPLNAIREWIGMKVGEIYRAANIGGMAATEISTQAKSGAALVAEFQLLNSTLVRKAIHLEKAERRLTYLWYLWQYDGQQAKKLMDETKIERDRSYDVENLAIDLENTLTAKTIVKSKLFNAEVQKRTVRKFLPSWNDTQLIDIDEEIEAEAQKPEAPNPFGFQQDQDLPAPKPEQKLPAPKTEK